LTPDVVARFDTVPAPEALGRVAGIVPVGRQSTMRIGPAGIAGTTVTVAGVDPATFRAFTPPGTAEVTDVWAAAAAGDVVVSYALAGRLNLPLGGTVPLTGAAGQQLQATIGAFADTGLPDIDAVVSNALADKLALPGPNAIVLSGATGDPGDVARAARRLSLPGLQVDLLRGLADRKSFFTSDAMRNAFGVLHYQETPDGKIIPDPAWVRANIVRAQVPILGWVMCHRLMIPQMSGALADIEAQGLAGLIHPNEYEGCYVPKLIEDSNVISMHTWGLAFDINVPTNQRGTHGDMDPRVVDTFKRWGFRWGGDFRTVPDPMHFELVALMSARSSP
jgi:D-alanyl-D-alanine carboxypeptidase